MENFMRYGAIEQRREFTSVVDRKVIVSAADFAVFACMKRAVDSDKAKWYDGGSSSFSGKFRRGLNLIQIY
jgi:hypothetical protein